MKVVIIPKGKGEKKPPKPRREEYVVMSRKLWETKPGHLAIIEKKYFAYATHIEIKKYLKKMYRGCFVLIAESKTQWIVRRVEHKVNGAEEIQENEESRRRYYYLPERKSRNSKVASGEDN
jgi:hypothetical protein